jgi:hypothetical protein
VDETSKTWQLRLDWEKEQHECHKKRLSKLKYEVMCKHPELAQIFSTEYSHQRMKTYRMLKYDLRYGYYVRAWESCERKRQDSKEKIEDLEQKLRSVAYS